MEAAGIALGVLAAAAAVLAIPLLWRFEDRARRDVAAWWGGLGESGKPEPWQRLLFPWSGLSEQLRASDSDDARAALRHARHWAMTFLTMLVALGVLFAIIKLDIAP